jgi:hypothetical protein
MKEEESLFQRVCRMWFDGIVKESMLMFFGLGMLFFAPILGNNLYVVILFLSIAIVGMIIFFKGTYVNPMKTFILKYSNIEPISSESALFLDQTKLGLKYITPFVDREYMSIVGY